MLTDLMKQSNGNSRESQDHARLPKVKFVTLTNHNPVLMARANTWMITLNEGWLPHNCTKQWLINCLRASLFCHSEAALCCYWLLCLMRLVYYCCGIMIRSDRFALSVLWMSDWLCDSDLRWWCSRCLSVGPDPGQWPLSSAPRIPADTHRQSILYELYVIFVVAFFLSISTVDSTLIWPVISDKKPIITVKSLGLDDMGEVNIMITMWTFSW